MHNDTQRANEQNHKDVTWQSVQLFLWFMVTWHSLSLFYCNRNPITQNLIQTHKECDKKTHYFSLRPEAQGRKRVGVLLLFDYSRKAKMGKLWQPLFKGILKINIVLPYDYSIETYLPSYYSMYISHQHEEHYSHLPTCLCASAPVAPIIWVIYHN